VLKVLTEISAFRNNHVSDFSAFPLAIRFFPYMMNLIGTSSHARRPRPDLVAEKSTHEDERMAKTLQEKIIEAEERGGRYLADANEAAERGNHEKAEKLYAKGQFWLDRMNVLLGNA
jgi:hypothetical protein